jgi:hypothetical protein
MIAKRYWLALVLAAGFVPAIGWSCACGCGVFDVGTGAMLPTAEGGFVWLEYDYMDQNRNWIGGSRAGAALNEDKKIRTSFYTLGLQYMFGRDWGVVVEAPYWDRYFLTTDEEGALSGHRHGAFGDVRLKGVYSGFSDDMSTGVTFGVKLPTGDSTYRYFDRDTQIGTGSTDLLLGAYHMGRLGSDGRLDWFVRGQWQKTLKAKGGYHPGDETDLAAGVYANGISAGKGKLVPMVQVILSIHSPDTGAEAEPDDTGYTRTLIAPGLEYDLAPWRIYGEVELPIHQHVNGQQLVAPAAFKLVIGFAF